LARERVVDQTVDGDVQPGTHTERDVDVTSRAQMAGHRPAASVGLGAHEPLPPEAASQQVVVGDIPLEPAGFLPRPDLLARLDRAGARVAVLHAVTGLRGLGTTQLAAAYARAKLAADWRLVAWVNAVDADSLHAGLAAVADAIGLTERDSGRQVADAGEAVRHLLETDGDRCLLVFDDVADFETLRPLLPARGTARVLITSTRPPTGHWAAGVPVDVFSADEALRFLTERTGLDDEAGAAAVVSALGHLPLALALAAPMIERQHHGYARYLNRLQTIPIEVFLTGDDGQSYPHGVARTVLLSLAVMRAADPTGVSTGVMEIMAVLSPAGVRRELLHAAGQAGALAAGGRRVETVLVDRVLDWLSDRSILTFSLDGQTAIMSRQVAQVVRARLARRQRLGAVCWAAASVLEGYAAAVSSAQDRLAVRSIPQHVTALVDNTPRLAGKADEELALILLGLRFIAFYHLVELGGSVRRAIEVGELLTAHLVRLLGPDHPDTLNARNSLAAAYLAAGRAAEAIPLFEQILALRQGLLGPEDPDTLTSRNNLAAAYQDAGRAGEAIQLFEQTLSVRERLLGEDDPGTLNSRGNLASAYRDARRTAEAIPLFEQVLADRERVLGPDHPDTQLSRKNLASAYRDVGRTAEAASLLERVMADQRRAARPGQPARRNLVTAYRDGSRAAGETEQALAERESQAALGAVGHVVHAGVRRPPADRVKRALPPGFRRPPADPARRLLADRRPGPPTKLTSRSSASRTQHQPPVDLQRDRELVATITAGDPAGIATLYDTYAAALYGYCYGVLRDAADAAAALQDTFVIALATLKDLPEPEKLRPWLYAVARGECRRRLRTRPAARGEEEADAVHPQAAMHPPVNAGHRADAAGRSAVAPDWPIDATMPFGAVIPLMPIQEPIDATMPFRAVSASAPEPADTTMQFRAIRPPALPPIDATVPFRAVSPPNREPADATMKFRAVSRPGHQPVDATTPIRVVSQATDATMPIRMIGQTAHEPIDAPTPARAGHEPAGAIAALAHVNGDAGRAELRALIRSILADLKPREREVIELSFRHDLSDTDLALALGLSQSRVQFLTSRATGRLEKSLGAVHATLAGRQACPVLGELLVDWDGQLTEQTRDLVGWHVEQCQTCAHQGGGALRPAALPGVLPLASLPPELREQVLTRCSDTAKDTAAYRRRVVRRAHSTWFALFAMVRQAIRRMSWASIRANPGTAVASTAIAIWIVAAVVVSLATVAGFNAAHALETRPSVRPSVSSSAAPLATATTPITVPASASVSPAPASASPTPSLSLSPTYVRPSYVPTVQTEPSASASHSARPHKSPKPSASPSPSASPTPSPSPDATPSPSPA
jgi:RNA polymerase sigma factor (sigma-70 family)